MTNKEAYVYLSKVSTGHYKLDIAIETALIALEKEIPEKPIEDDEKYCHCPVCNRHLVPFDEPYCGHCGQSIDWREDNG